MRRTFVYLAALAALQVGLAAGQTDPAAVPRMSVADLKQGMDRGLVLVVDVRDAASFAAGHIPGAVLILPEEIGRKAAELKASRKTVVTYCA